MTLPRPHAASPRKQAAARWFRKHGAGPGAAAAPASQAGVQGSGAFARGSGTANAAAPPLLRALLPAADAPWKKKKKKLLLFNPEFAIGFSRSNADQGAGRVLQMQSEGELGGLVSGWFAGKGSSTQRLCSPPASRSG